MPIEKKSTMGASRAAVRAAAGTSIMMPTSTAPSAGTATPSAASVWRACPTSPSAARTSCSVATIGNMIFSGWPAATRSTARS